MTQSLDDAIARRRFMVINLVRLAGIGMLLLGVAILADTVGWPDAAGYALIVAGAVGTFLAPTFLARRWSSKRRQ